VMDLQGLLQMMVNKRASDLHIRAGHPPYLRIDGELAPAIPDIATPQDVEAMMFSVMNNRAKKIYEAKGEADFSFQAGEVARFRVNAFKQRQKLCMAIRMIPMTFPNLQDLRLPV